MCLVFIGVWGCLFCCLRLVLFGGGGVGFRGGVVGVF